MAAATGRIQEVTAATPEAVAATINDEGDEHYKRAPFRLKTYAGTSDAITAAGDPFNINIHNDGTNTLLDGQLILFIAQATSTTTTPKLAIDSVAAKTMTDYAGGALAVGEVVINTPYLLQYNSVSDHLRIILRGGEVIGALTVLGDLTADKGLFSVGGTLALTDDGTNPRVYFDGDGGADRIQYILSSNTKQLVLGNVVHYQWDATSFSCGVDLRNDLGTASIRWQAAYAAKLEIDPNFHMEIDGSSDPRITMDSGDDFVFDRSANQYVFQIASANAFRIFSGGEIVPEGPVRFKSYTVAALPTGTAGNAAYASDGRKAGEGAAAGTGLPVFFDGTNWLSDYYNNVTVVA